MTSTDLMKSIMNRFLHKKKGGDDPVSPPQVAKKWKKGKKMQHEHKPQLDLTSALPSTDEFRTSLIMPTLSTRFSMLREQDDPKSKLGKASDDSVLHPHRQSRLLDFGFSSNGLNDIAEVASIKSSVRPPFARDRHGSFASEDGYGTDNESSHHGSMISRARPGEGNMLFSGRQKVYKIPSSSARSISGTSERTMGRQLYDDDLNLSAFQKYRQHQREAAESPSLCDGDSALRSPETDVDSRHSQDKTVSSTEDSVGAIGLGLSQPESTFDNRASDSTTTSLPSLGRSSTAATSVASQPIGTAVTTASFAQPPPTAQTPAVPVLERSLTKRRLYEQGLEKSMHDQQASTMTRLNSIQRHRSPTVGSTMSPPALSHSRSIGQLQERNYQPFALQNPPQSAKNSFPPVASLRKVATTNISPTGSYPQSPLSPTMSDSEEYKTLHSALEPNDRGKATAMGAFNKPKHQYDEEQYMQRQVQLQQSNQSSISRQSSVDSTRQQDARLARFDSARQTNESRASQRSRSTSVASKVESASNKAFAVFQNAAIQNRVAHGESPHLPPTAPPPLPPSNTVDTQRTFFGDISASEDEEDDIVADFERSGPLYAPSNYTMPPTNGRFTPTPLPSVSEHPALRHETPNIPEVDEDEEDQRTSSYLYTKPDVSPLVDTEAGGSPETSADYPEVDSPTIGMKDSIGGLIHHLRQASDQSSIYPPVVPSAGTSSFQQESAHIVSAMDERVTSTYSETNAWDLDDLESYYGDGIGKGPPSDRGYTPARGEPLRPASSKANISRPSTRDSNIIDGGLWQNDFKKQHTREASTATQAERQAFDDELAARQRAIQEKMKSIVESESRSTSPAPTSNGALKAFGMLRSKASHEVMQKDTSFKAIKMLGLGAQGVQQDKYSIYEDAEANASGISMHQQQQHPALAASNNDQWPLSGAPLEATYMNAPQVPPSRDGRGTVARVAAEINGRDLAQQGAGRARSRSRSASTTSQVRARSRAGEYRDEFGTPPQVPAISRARPSIDTARTATPTSGDAQGRKRSNSKPGSYFESRGLQSSHSSAATGRMTGGVSPASASASVSPATQYGGAMGSTGRPSYSTSTTPPVAAKSSNASGPFGQGGSSSKPNALRRKKTINKADISEPTLISSTSNVDTIDLDKAAKMVQPPMVPPLNPRRRVMTQMEMGPDDRGSNASFTPPMPQHATTFAGHGSEGWNMNGVHGGPYAQSVRSADSMDRQGTRFDAVGSPVMNEAGMF